MLANIFGQIVNLPEIQPRSQGFSPLGEMRDPGNEDP